VVPTTIFAKAGYKSQPQAGLLPLRLKFWKWALWFSIFSILFRNKSAAQVEENKTRAVKKLAQPISE
jgi:hypothetical protein